MAIPSPQVISTVDTVSDQRLDIDGTVWQLSTNTNESVILYGITDNAGTNYEIGYLKERPAVVNFYGTMAAPAVSGETEVTTLGAIASTKFYVDYDRAFMLFPDGHSTPVNVTYKGMGSIQKAKDVNEAIRAAEWAVTRYLGAFITAAEPSVDNSGNALVDGALYYNTSTNLLMVYDLATTAWSAVAPTSVVPSTGGAFTGQVTFNGPYVKLPVHADDSARDTAVPSPATGMLIYNTASGALQQYNGVWSTIAPAPNISAVSGFLNDDSDSTLTLFGSNFSASSAVKMFSASSGGSQIGSNATTTFNSSSKLTAVFGAGSIGASGSTAYIEVDNVGATNRFATAITVNADPTVVHAGATGTSANTTTHLGTYGGATAGGGTDANTKLLLNFDRADGSTDIEDSSNTGDDGHKAAVSGSSHIEVSNGIYKFGTAAGKVYNSSAYFDGDSAVGGDKIFVGTPPACLLSSSKDWTIEFWFYYTTLSSTLGRNQTIFRCEHVDDGTIGHNFRFYLSSAGNLSCYFLNGAAYVRTGSTYHVASFQTAYPPNTWHHWAFTHTTAGIARLYMNGKYVAPDGSTHANWAGELIGGGSGGLCFGGGSSGGEGSLLGYIDQVRVSDNVRYTGTTTSSTWSNFSEITSPFGAVLSQTIPTITFTGTATQLAGDEDIEFTSVANTTKAANNQHLTDSGIGLTLTNLTGGDKNKATLTGTIASDEGTTHTNMPMKVQVRKTLATAAYADASRVVTFSGSETTAGLAPAMPVTGTGIPASTTITTVDTATTITLSANPTGGTLTGQSLVFSDLNRVAHVNGAEVLATGDSMLTIATGTGGDPVLFNARRYTGNYLAREITGFGFQPDLIWAKARSLAYTGSIWDSLRGATKWIRPDTTGAQATSANGLTEFTSGGFKSGVDTSNENINGAPTYIAWGWKAGGAPSGELVGSGATMSGTSGNGTIHNSATGVSNLTSLTQSVNQTSGFSITKFEGHTSGGTFPHNLGATPAFIIIKNVDAAQNWTVWHQNMAATSDYHLVLNTTVAQQSNSLIYPTAPSSTIIYTGVAPNNGGQAVTIMSYAWKAVAGVSAFGSYTGNAGANTITYTGSNSFTARWIIIKKISATGNWIMLDGFRESTAEWTTRLKANGTETESSDAGYGLTPTADTGSGSGGFSFDAASTDADVNTSGTYIYAAFA